MRWNELVASSAERAWAERIWRGRFRPVAPSVVFSVVAFFWGGVASSVCGFSAKVCAKVLCKALCFQFCSMMSAHASDLLFLARRTSSCMVLAMLKTSTRALSKR